MRNTWSVLLLWKALSNSTNYIGDRERERENSQSSSVKLYWKAEQKKLHNVTNKWEASLSISRFFRRATCHRPYQSQLHHQVEWCDRYVNTYVASRHVCFFLSSFRQILHITAWATLCALPWLPERSSDQKIWGHVEDVHSRNRIPSLFNLSHTHDAIKLLFLSFETNQNTSIRVFWFIPLFFLLHKLSIQSICFLKYHQGQRKFYKYLL